MKFINKNFEDCGKGKDTDIVKDIRERKQF
jgi:hypothetical protein